MNDWPDAPLPFRVGQIFVARADGGTIALCHRDDAQRDDLRIYREPEEAAALARFDDAGVYRPLKTAPNLAHGWRMLLANFEQMRLALDHFYPGRAAAFRAWKNRELRTVPLRETLNRQTGMYRVAAKISDAKAGEVIADFCRSDGGCLRTILWPRDMPVSLPREKFDPAFDQMGRDEETLPLLCQEACNLLVAKMRGAVKANE